MTFGSSISVCFSKYADFEGRASRSEYWWFYLFCILFETGGGILGAMVGGAGGFILLYGIAVLIISVPYLAVGARRLHDIGKSGWNLLWTLTVIGTIPLVVWLCTEGTKASNEYGDPIEMHPV